jgi:hypothetical protein
MILTIIYIAMLSINIQFAYISRDKNTIRLVIASLIGVILRVI